MLDYSLFVLATGSLGFGLWQWYRNYCNMLIIKYFLLGLRAQDKMPEASRAAIDEALIRLDIQGSPFLIEKLQLNSLL